MTLSTNDGAANAGGGAVLVVVGIGCDGWDGLGNAARRALQHCGEIWGSERQILLLPQELAAKSRSWGASFAAGVSELICRVHEEPAGQQSAIAPRFAVLASGDPMHFGIGERLSQQLPSGWVKVIPQVSCATLGCAALGWSGGEVEVISVCGRELSTMLSAMAGTAGKSRFFVLCSPPNTPAAVADYLSQHLPAGAVRSAHLLGNLGGSNQLIEHVTLAQLSTRAYARSDLFMLALDVEPNLLAARHATTDEGSGANIGGFRTLPGRPASQFAHDSQTTRAELRAIALAHLNPQPHELLWDVGAGNGTVCAEWLLQCPQARAIAVECRNDRIGNIEANKRRYSLAGLRVVAGEAPAALAGLPPPQAIFIGGAASKAGVIETCIAALKASPGACAAGADRLRLIAHAVTLESEASLLAAQAAHGGVLTRIALSHNETIGRFTAMRPAMAVLQWFWQSGAH